MALNIPAMMQHARPVDARLEGKAARQALQSGKLDQALKAQQIALNDIALQSAGRPDPTEIREQQTFQIERMTQAIDMGIEYQAKSLSAYQDAIAGGKPEDEALAAAQSIFNRGIKQSQTAYPDLAGAGLFDDDNRFDPAQAEALIETATSMRERLKGAAGGSPITLWNPNTGSIKTFIDRNAEEPRRLTQSGWVDESIRQATTELERLIGTLPPEQRDTVRNALVESRTTPSIQDVIAPIIARISRGEEITAAERKALDEAQKIGTVERIIRESLVE